MSEAAEFPVGASVAPARVVGVEAEHESADLARRGRSAGSGLWWLGPVAGAEASVPPDDGGRLDDQHDAVEPATVEGTRQYGQDRSVCRSEPWSLDLSLEDEDLMAKRQDLGVTLVTGYEKQPEPSNRSSKQVREDR